MINPLIYFDNAATTRIKPDCVYEAYNFYVREIGVSPGRGAYSLGIEASRMLFQARRTVANFFGSYDPSNVVFTKNSTEALNLFIKGFLKMGDHVIISSFEHNAVLRPVHRLKELGIIDYSIVFPEGLEDVTKLEEYIKPNTRLAIFTLASNLTGQIVFDSEKADYLKKRNIIVLLDSSQGAGKIDVNLTRDSVDVVAFTGHKDLFAMPGVGGLVFKKRMKLEPLIQGGTGIYGHYYSNPDIFPESYESGTLNMPSIWSLKAALDFLTEHKHTIKEKEKKLTDYLIKSLVNIPNITIYEANKTRVSTLCFNISDIPSNKIVEKLSKCNICVRGGIHCAILAHNTIGTSETGAVRVSLNYMNSTEEIDYMCDVLKGL